MKITSCDGSFAALSELGDVYLFSAPNDPPSEISGKEKWAIPKPQRVWALRKQFSAVKVG
jgi:inhibitor of Bruton tyrosine kinase